ncbi:TetR/AcrR family transcriptional regulator [Bailinhaonella thermotolerans]|uniref:TetR family transcriptional regulator n=1 Tax=Bailinhaonella thermotolerans TaxID=1070861 RepID=A0A3A4AQ87_9ACTN|nr:TetR/AcrR family transcriptional regulator [Bailinhaonella thermotolerans]RJL31866.1 TetR family transcriptional regulator [Bailinhaonella thermotolerans]
MTTDTLGLREQKKLETRQLISDQATRLFIERGFEETTIADIAHAARVAKKTVTNYFARKEDLALDHHEQFVASLANVVASRAPGQSALAALREAFLEAARQQNPVAGFAGLPFTRMIEQSPTLVARLRDLHEQREQALAAVLRAETNAVDDDITPDAVGAQLGAAHRVLFQQIQRLTLEGLPGDEVAERVTASALRVFDLLHPSLGDYAIRPRP